MQNALLAAIHFNDIPETPSSMNDDQKNIIYHDRDFIGSKLSLPTHPPTHTHTKLYFHMLW